MGKTLIIGYGNPLRSDDSFGWHAGGALARELAGQAAEVITCHQLTPELAEPLSQCDRAVFIDADAEGKAGEIRCRDVHPRATSPSVLTHSCSPEGLLASAELLYGHHPQAVIITVSAQSFAFGDSLSPVVSPVLPRVVELVFEFVTNAGRLLIVGCGSPDAGDDSAGLEVIRRLREGGDCGCELRAESAPGIELLDALALAEAILFVDAVVSGGAPGTLHLATLPCKEVEPRSLGALSSHGWGLAEALDLARALGRTMPPLFLLGIEAGTVAQGSRRSPAVEQAVERVIENLTALRLLLLRSKILPIRSFNPSDRSFPGFANQASES